MQNRKAAAKEAKESKPTTPASATHIGIVGPPRAAPSKATKLAAAGGISIAAERLVADMPAGSRHAAVLPGTLGGTKSKQRRRRRKRGGDTTGCLFFLAGIVICCAFMGWRFPEVIAHWRRSFSLDAFRDWGMHQPSKTKDLEQVLRKRPAWEWLRPQPILEHDWRADRPGDLTAAEFVGAGRRPRLLRSTPVNDWPATKWSAEDIGRAMPLLPNVYSSSRPSFQYYDANASGPPRGWVPSYTLVNCTARCFLDGSSPNHLAGEGCGDCKGRADGRYLYFSSPLGPRSPTAAVWEGVQGRLSQLSVGENPTANIWIAGAGVTTAAHYDSYHNFLIQLHGTKQGHALYSKQQSEEARVALLQKISALAHEDETNMVFNNMFADYSFQAAETNSNDQSL